MVNKSKGINKKLLSITSDFIQSYYNLSVDLGIAILYGKIVTKKLLEKKITDTLIPAINDYFNNGVAAYNKIVPAKISKLTDQLHVPFKYNKTILKEIDDTKIWNGYMDAGVKKQFKATEINKMKSTIIGAKYSGLEEKRLIQGIKNVVNVTDNKARQIARGMTAQMDTVANQIYLGKKKVRDEYELVWSQNTSYERHAHMNGEVADENGMFYDSKTGSRIPGPPYQSSPWNCLCTEYWRKKSK